MLLGLQCYSVKRDPPQYCEHTFSLEHNTWLLLKLVSLLTGHANALFLCFSFFERLKNTTQACGETRGLTGQSLVMFSVIGQVLFWERGFIKRSVK